MQTYRNFELPENMKQLNTRLARTSYCIRDVSLEVINQAMQQIVNDTESMSIEYRDEPADVYINDADGVKQQHNIWMIKYGTKLISDTYVARTPLYHLYNRNIHKVCETVVERFPFSAHEIEPFDIDVVPPPPERIRKWSVVGVSAYSNHKPGESPTFVLEFSHVDGDRSTRFWIYDRVISLIDNVIMWNSRGAYLSLIEGTEYKKDPVRGYLFNDMISRELCAFLPR